MPWRASLAVAVVLLLGGLEAFAQDTQRHPRVPTVALRADEKLATFETRPGVTVRLLIRLPVGPPKGVFLMFPGGEGFLVGRSGAPYGAFRGDFAQNGFATAVMDAPSDQINGMENPPRDTFRISAAYTEDLKATVAMVKEAVPGPIYLFGHSMGAVSAAHTAATVGDPDIRALIMAGSPTPRRWSGTGVTPLDAARDKITIPVLVIHNRYDACSGATFNEASDFPRRFMASPRASLLEARGGLPPESKNPCEGNNYHSFYGIRDKVVRDIIRWLNGENIRRIED